MKSSALQKKMTFMKPFRVLRLIWRVSFHSGIGERSVLIDLEWIVLIISLWM